MLCKNCGNQIADDAAFCGVCGAKIVEEVAAEQAAPAEAPVTAEAPVETPVAPAEAPAPATPVAPASATKKFPKKLLYIGLPIIAIVVVIALFFNSISAMFVKMFGSDSSYLAYVEGKALGGYSTAVTNLYGNSQNALDGVGVEGEMVLEVGDTLTTMLSSYASGMDLSWLKQIKIVVDADTSMSNGSGKLIVMLGDQSVLTLEYIMDNENGTMYLRVKELNDKFVKVAIPDTSGMEFMSTATAQSNSTNVAVEVIKKLASYLPSEEEVSKLLNKYIEVALKQITDDVVTKTSGEVTANGITEGCTVLEVKITEKLVLNVVKAIAEEAQNDGDIISILQKLQKGAEEIAPEAAEDNLVENYKTAIADGIAELNGLLAEINGNGQELFILTDYVNGNDEIIGRKIGSALMGDKDFAILSAEKGGETGFELSFGNEFAIVGKGTKSGDAITGEYALSVQGKEYLKLGLENFNASTEGTVSGAVVLKLGSGAASLMDSSVYSTVAMLNPSIKMEMDIKNGSGTYSLAVLTGESPLVKLSVSGKETSVDVAAAPADGDTISAEDFASALDFTTVIDNLKKAGVPESLLTILQYSIAG